MSQEDPHALDDTVMLARFQQIVQEHNIEVIVETGTRHGLSTARLAEMVQLVYAIENNPNSACITMGNVQNRKGVVAVVPRNSPTALQTLMPYLPGNTLYFLDAHWQAYRPLIDEIAAIRKGVGIIVIHDMKVPGHPELGYDNWGHDLDYEYVKDVLTEWSFTHRVEYNERSEGTNHPRGVGYIFPR